MAGAVCGTLSSLFAISFAYVIFADTLAPFQGQGVWLALLGTTIGAVFSLIGYRDGRTIVQAQSVVVVILSLSAGHVAEAMATAPPERLLATVVALIGTTTTTTGIAMLTISMLRVEKVAKSIPYPVIAGFLAATGTILLLRAVEFGIGDLVTFDTLRQSNFGAWLPPVAAAAAMLWANKRWNTAYVLIGGIIVYSLTILLWLLLGDMTVSETRAAGILVNMADTQSAVQNLTQIVTFAPLQFPMADWAVVASQYPLILTAAALGVLGALLNLSAIEFAIGESMDLNLDLRRSGSANLVAGLLGGLVTYSSATLTQLSHLIAPRTALRINLVAFLITLAVFLFGSHVLGFLPRGMFTMLLAYIGMNLVWRWLFADINRMPREDTLIVVVILLTTLAAGFVWAVLLGFVISSLRFTITYARLPILRGEFSGAMRLSSTERADRAAKLLTAHGGETQIFIAQGYMFFGTANILYTHIVNAVDTAVLNGQVRNVIVDFHHVQGIDVSAVLMFDRLARHARKAGFRLVFTGLRNSLDRQLRRALPKGKVRIEPSLDTALSALEKETLTHYATEARQSDLQSFEAGFRRLLNQIEATGTDLKFEVQSVPAGARVFEIGATADSMTILEDGRLYATIREGEKPDMRVATFLPGSVVGEIAFVMGGKRTASVVAETPCRLRWITRQNLEDLRKLDPDLAIRMNQMVSTLLAQRLARTTALLHAVTK